MVSKFLLWSYFSCVLIFAVGYLTLEESFSQLTHRNSFLLSIFSCGESPRRHRAYLWLSLMESDRLQARRYWSRMTRRIYQREPNIFGRFLVPSCSLCCFFLMVGLLIKATGVQRYEHTCCSEASPQGINSSLLIDTAIRLSNPFMGSSTQWGSLSSSTHPPIIFFFHPFGTLSFQCCSLGWNFGECFAPLPPFLFAWCLVLLFWISSWCIPQYTSVVGGKLQNLRPLIGYSWGCICLVMNLNPGINFGTGVSIGEWDR